MTDSIRVVQNDYIHQLHKHRGTVGRLYKGQAVTAATASIPSSYQTVVIDSSEKRGFNSQSKRFNYDLTSDDKPGPGTYSGVPTNGTSSASFSKRGTGMMASKDKRLLRQVTSCGPSPTAYNVEGGLLSRHDFNRSAVSSTFHLPIAVERPRSTGPAPNQYDTLSARVGRSNNVNGNAAFRSKTKRDFLFSGDGLGKPSPCQYDVNVSAVRESVRVPMSSFKSKTIRQFPQASATIPGPGQYKPFEPVEPVKKTVFPRHNYLCLSVPAMALPAAPEPPGPCSYDIHSSFNDSQKTDAKTAVFVSTTTRWNADTNNNNNFPSPAHYNPMPVGKQSFIYNSSSRWL